MRWSASISDSRFGAEPRVSCRIALSSTGVGLRPVGAMLDDGEGEHRKIARADAQPRGRASNGRGFGNSGSAPRVRSQVREQLFRQMQRKAGAAPRKRGALAPALEDAGGRVKRGSQL